MQDGEPFMGFVNLQGTAFEESMIATGLGNPFNHSFIRLFVYSFIRLFFYSFGRGFVKPLVHLAI